MGKKSVFQSAIERGVTRRDFIKMCTALAATMGLEYSQTDKVVNAMETESKLPVIWLQFQDCTGCSESFIRSSHPTTESVVLDLISLEYSEVLSAASGHQVEAAMEAVIEKFPKKYILATEGSIPEEGMYCMVGGKPAKEIYEHAAKNALAVIAYGSCAAWGGIAGAKPNPTNAKPVTAFDSGDTPVMIVPGCPPISEVMTGVIAHYITFGSLPELDGFGRPKSFFKHRIHDKCNRRAYFDAGLFVESFDDEASKQGYCLYKVGCKGPTTYNSCMEMRWNGGTSMPILSGNPCIGCSEDGFWDAGSFTERLADIPLPQKIATVNPAVIGGVITGVATAAVVAHGALTAVKKNMDDKKNPHEEH